MFAAGAGLPKMTYARAGLGVPIGCVARQENVGPSPLRSRLADTAILTRLRPLRPDLDGGFTVGCQVYVARIILPKNDLRCAERSPCGAA